MRFNEAAGIPRGRQGAPSFTDALLLSFNEAAGIPRGRRPMSSPWLMSGVVASMRPRVFPAEDRRRRRPSRSACKCFNEAAGIPRGRQSRIHRWLSDGRHASMRPRVFPAEDIMDAAEATGEPLGLQ